MDSMDATLVVAKDSGLLSLALVARIYHIKVDGAQLQRRYGHHQRPCSRDDILRAARSLDFRATKRSVELHSIAPESLPVIVRANDGRFLL